VPQPSPEYLRILDEFLECRDDESFHRIHAKLQENINRDLSRIRIENLFVERYKRVDDFFHIHCVLIIPEPFGRKRVLKACATCFAVNGPMVDRSPLKHGAVESLWFEDVQVSMFVDVRELRDGPQVIAHIPSIVRLHTFDDCERLFGNSWQAPTEVVVGQWGRLDNGRITFGGNLQKQGEFAPFDPVGGKLDFASIDLDEIECQVIKGRFDLIDGFPGEDCNVNVGIGTKIQCGFAVRIFGDSTRITSGVSGNAFLDRADMHRSPIQFQDCGFDTGDHSQILAREFKG
jgi:hypothetical protein